jgi:prepilin-type processing-associated H-X9-DG protein
LIELLVVIAIIAILAAILFPVFAQARAKARQATCLSNMKQVNFAIGMYVQDYDEVFPLASNETAPKARCETAPWRCTRWVQAVQPYAKSIDVFVCPQKRFDNLIFLKPPYVDPPTGQTGNRYSYFAWEGGSYTLNMGAVINGGCFSVQTPGIGNTTSPPASLASVGSPSATILVVEMTGAGPPPFNAHWGCGGPFGVPKGTPSPADPCGWWLQQWCQPDYRHQGTMNVAWVDGHVKAISKAQLEEVRGTDPNSPDYSLWDKQ